MHSIGLLAPYSRWLCPRRVALQYVGIPYFQGGQATDVENEGKDAGVSTYSYLS